MIGEYIKRDYPLKPTVVDKLTQQLLECSKGDLYPLDIYEALVFDRDSGPSKRNTKIHTVYYAHLAYSLNEAGFKGVSIEFDHHNPRMTVSATRLYNDRSLEIRFSCGFKKVAEIVQQASNHYAQQVVFQRQIDSEPYFGG